MIRPRLLAAAVILAAASRPTAAAADDAGASAPSHDQCADAYEKAQRLRKEYALRAAHEQLMTCANQACPGFVKQDCAKWLGEVEASTPTVVILAHGADGQAIEDVHVTMDGQPLTDHLDGRAIAVDPGPHTMRYEAGGKVAEERVIVAEGVKNQQIVAQIGAPAPAATAQPETPAPASHRTVPTATWVLGGVAVVGAISFATFAAMGRSVQGCAPSCSRSQVDDLRRDYVIADASWITGLVAAGAALYFYLTAPTVTSTPVTALRW
jgi:hypothetical protein